MELSHRPRRLRQNKNYLRLQRETHFHPGKFILPLFICEGSGIEKSHPLVPGCKTLSYDKLKGLLDQVNESKISSVLLFGVSDKRDAKASEAFNKNSALVKGISFIRDKYPDLLVATDIALDPYTDHGHDGLFKDGVILNDESVEALCEMSILHAKAGAHILAPSDMMDGRIAAIRGCLDSSSYEDRSILSYTAKYASAYYGPFRDTLSSKVIGDKTSYQMDPANRREAMKELELDLAEGADMVVVKPASHYLDIISDFRHASNVPVAAYHVSGECALLELGAKNGLFDRDRALLEVTTSIFRAGADLIVTYYALELSRLCREA